MPTTISHWINNTVFPGTSAVTAPVTNPATGAVTGEVVLGSVEDGRAVIDAAATAFPAWRDTSLARRSAVLFTFREQLNARKQELAGDHHREHGKVVSDALGEVGRGQEIVEFACGIPQLIKGGFTENASTKVDVASIRQPLGPVGIISPFNFPARVPMWFFPIAIAAATPWYSSLGEGSDGDAVAGPLWAEACLPHGVFNVCKATRRRWTVLLTPNIKSVSLRRLHAGRAIRLQHAPPTGSGSRPWAARRTTRWYSPTPISIWPPTPWSPPASAPPANAAWRSRRGRPRPGGRELVAKIAERDRTIKTGAGRREADMGPLVTGAPRQGGLLRGRRRAAGRKVVVDGRNVRPRRRQRRVLARPDPVRPRHPRDVRLHRRDLRTGALGGERRSYEEALELVNANPYGNGSAIFTNDGGAARRFQNEVEVGMVGINVPIPVPMAYYSFGGWKASLFGDAHAHGTQGVQFFTRGKAITSRAGVESEFPLVSRRVEL